LKGVDPFPLRGRLLTVWDDPTPRSGPLLMALDQALVRHTDVPVLRIYRWDGPWISIGCFVPRAEAEAAFPGRPVVRRWTGGGIVDHTDDWTYSLILPPHDPLAATGTTDSYRLIHGALARALTACGKTATLAEAPPPGRNGLCFQSPVRADVLCGTRKIAGAAQRRTRHGLLHQGSVQGIAIPDGLAAALAAALHPEPAPIDDTLTRTVLPQARQLVEQQYGTSEWLDGPGTAGRATDA